MENKYLTKLAGLFDSDETNVKHIQIQHLAATQNLYASHFNKVIGGINDKYQGDKWDKNKYVDEIVSTMKAHPQLNADYKKLHETSNAKIQRYGGPKLRENFLHAHIDQMGDNYRDEMPDY